MRLGKATGPDSISVKLSEALEDFGIYKIEHYSMKSTIQVYLLTYCPFCRGQLGQHDTSLIPPNMSKSILTALPKKPTDHRV